MMSLKAGNKQKVTFLHPDLGIGGAERLIVDAAVGLQEKGYEVCIVTAYHDPKRAFPETVNGTIKVISVGWWIPRSIFGRFVALCAYIKMIYAGIYLTLFSRIHPKYVICDQVSACIPFLRLRWNPFACRPKVLFYCHFPDQLLTQRLSFIKRLYRWPIDWFEEFTTSLADKIVVNSQFTCGVFKKTFKRINQLPAILYPSINTSIFDILGRQKVKININNKYIFLSINRFERKKNIELAISAMNKLKQCLSVEDWDEVHLVLAGGYDERLEEAVSYLKELKEKVEKENLLQKVTFILSPSDNVKVHLLSKATALIYTPSNEHFGIVPLEAMYMGKPVIAVDSGGPRETIKNEETGFLRPAINTHFGVAMARLIKDPELVKKLGKNGKARFNTYFSFQAFSNSWLKALESLEKKDK